MQQKKLIAKIREKVEQCRRLADATTDPRTAFTLRSMAEEGEADIKRLLKEGKEP